MDRRQYLSAERLFELCNEHLEDPRRPSGNIRHKLIDIFVIGLLGIMGGLEDWESIEEGLRIHQTELAENVSGITERDAK